MDVSYRSIAKLLARGMPIDGQDYSDMIEAYIKSIEAMPPEHQHTLSASYIFSSLARTYERQDLFQELVAYTLSELAKYDGRIKDLAQAYIRCYPEEPHAIFVGGIQLVDHLPRHIHGDSVVLYQDLGSNT